MKRIFCVLIICFHLSNTAWAAVSTAIATEKGPSISGAVINVKDDKYDYMIGHPTTWQQEFSNKSVVDKVTLRYTAENKRVYTYDWDLSVSFTLKSWNQSGVALPDVSGTLAIEYHRGPGKAYKDIDVFSIPNGYKTQLIITAVNRSASLTATPTDVVIESSIETERYYKLNQNASVTIQSKKDDYTNTLEFTWPFINGAEEYDLEWVFISDQRLVKQPVNPSLEFDNATRISTTKNSYKINLVYDDGLIYYRVRGVGRKGSNFTLRQEGNWSQPQNIHYTNFEHKRNWSYSATYAEDGKSKEVVNFFDGSGRTRQAVTKLNTENTVLATETMYDFEGRPGIQTLPAPINDYRDQNGNETDNRISRLDFYKQYSLSQATGLAFSSKDFDSDEFFSSTTCKAVSGLGMAAAQGASNYYSLYNEDKEIGFNAALPDAQLFPFTQTVYDKEGKVKMESGPGDAHKIGSTHETQYFNATVLQPQLDRLFGNDVGDARHYSQKAVMDPNGQLSVSYLDLSGKTIASFLTGANTTNLDDLTAASTESVDDNFNALNTLSATEDAMVVDAKYLVTSLTEYEFTYDISQANYNSMCTQSSHVCTYDLTITIFDECDQPVLDANNEVLNHSFLVTGAFNKTFTVTFPHVGIYKIRKKLTLNQEALNAAVSYFKSRLPGSCITSLTDITNSYLASIDYTDCNISACEQNCRDAATASGLVKNSADWVAAVELCKLNTCAGGPNVQCEVLYEQFATDMSPGGQYCENKHTAAFLNPEQWLNGNVWDEGNSDAWIAANFLDKTGNVIFSWGTLKDKENWKPIYATQPFNSPIAGKNSLVEFHPEYCHYQWCIGLESSTKFDMLLAAIPTYKTAVATLTSKGRPFLDFDPVYAPVGKTILDADPYFVDNGQGISEYNTMLGYLYDMDGGGPQGSMVSQASAMTVGCNATIPDVCSNEFWGAFKALYAYKKARLVYEHKAAATCVYLCDDTSPPDNIADACSNNTSVEHYEIRVPYPNLEALNVTQVTTAIDDKYIVDCTPQDPSGPPCITSHHCLCDQISNYKKLYEYVSPFTGEHYVNTVTYPTLGAYIVACLNQKYGFAPGVPLDRVLWWIESCKNTNNENPQVPMMGFGEEEGIVNAEDKYAIALRCDEIPPECNTDAEVIAKYYANQQYNKLIKQATENFIANYKAACLNTTLETFSVTHDQKDFQYTLYYYDRAGNLLKTVPPQGVRALNNIDTKQVDDYRHNVAGATEIYPLHQLVTSYAYNSLNQLTAQNTPDAGTSHFWYNDVGQLRFSMNAKQAAQAIPNQTPGPYSYTKYDEQGRIVEMGESKQNPPEMETGQGTVFYFDQAVNNAAFPVNQRKQVTQTKYDAPYSLAINNLFPGQKQKNLRSRVATLSYDDDAEDNSVPAYNHATHYSYDPHGNVNILLQDYPDLKGIQQDIKKIEYDYDLVSGKVNQVSYQRNALDQFYHRYTYDDDNRITSTFTSKDGVIWSNDAKYYYYLHGPLARVELGDKKVQGLDYAYTIQGWLKSVNGSAIDAQQDIGKDGIPGNKYDPSQTDLHKNIARDVFAYSLNYFKDDYTAINQDAYHQFLGNINDSDINIEDDDLFNGNIKMKTLGLMKIDPVDKTTTQLPVAITNYRYDQLNRLKKADYQFSADNQFSNLQITGEYNSSYQYDRNGNILSLKRNGSASKGIPMDELTYHYDYANGNPLFMHSNRLLHVSDDVPGNTNYDDIEDQGSFGSGNWNYKYDEIGNLTGDKQEGIANIDWTVYGKIKGINRIPGFKKIQNDHESGDLEFAYDASGNRILKTFKRRENGVLLSPDKWTSTYYVRDAEGNVMATYERSYTKLGSNLFTDEFKLQDNTLYGSARLGIYHNAALSLSRSFELTIAGGKFTDRVYGTPIVNPPCLDLVCPERYRSVLGMKQYELSDYLGNVVSVVSDNVLSIDDIGSDGIADYFRADLMSVSDYYPFGSEILDRTSGELSYRYGFNGQEKDDEVSGVGNSYSAEFWEYSPRLGKRWNIDPKFQKYPEQSPYACFNGNPILYSDPTGESGVATINKESKTITIESTIILYGSKANKFLATTTAMDIQNLWNNAHAKVKIDGVEYQVKFIVKGEYRQDDKKLRDEIVTNKDHKNNYFRVEDKTDTDDGSGVSYTDHFGNTGVFNYNEIKNNKSTTEAHEWAHGFTLDHNHYFAVEIIGIPDIMDTRGDYINSPYSLVDGTLDISTRVVTQENVMKLFPQQVIDGLMKYGSGGLGTLTNKYHSAPEKPAVEE